jgi:hypothetical protein
LDACHLSRVKEDMVEYEQLRNTRRQGMNRQVNSDVVIIDQVTGNPNLRGEKGGV